MQRRSFWDVIRSINDALSSWTQGRRPPTQGPSSPLVIPGEQPQYSGGLWLPPTAQTPDVSAAELEPEPEYTTAQPGTAYTIFGYREFYGTKAQWMTTFVSLTGEEFAQRYGTTTLDAIEQLISNYGAWDNDRNSADWREFRERYTAMLAARGLTPSHYSPQYGR